MSLSLTFSALRASRPAAKAIVWPRMDQKSCLKAIVAAGFTPIVVGNLIEVRLLVSSQHQLTLVGGTRIFFFFCGVFRPSFQRSLEAFPLRGVGGGRSIVSVIVAIREFLWACGFEGMITKKE